ncbi:MAG: GMC family oxidoreductase [Verrucomicrobia bacterium]|nr:GMC family oxidoreductase [Verrucomicrobiota bacterium]
MPLITPAQLQKNYDVIIVGSGAGGGQTAYTLTLEGVKVLLLEAGRNYVPEKETPMFQTPHQAPLRGAGTPDKPFGFYDSTVDGGWTVPGEPYTSASTQKEREFWWWRARMLGGRTNHWGRYSFRNGPYDFKPRSRDGLGFDWPIGYADLAPYYDKVEMLIGVYGDNHGLENTPDSPAGVLLPPPKPRVSDLLVRKHARPLGLPVVAAHRAVLTRRLDAENLPAKLHPGNSRAQRLVREAMEGRAACFWATECGRGCSIRAAYQSPTVHLPPAMASGNLDLLTNAMAREVTTNAAGKATGIVFIDKTTGLEHRAAARVVVLAASSGETVRLLLNSKSARFPQGLANSSGLVGKYLMDTVGSSLVGQFPALENLPPHNEDGAGGEHMYAPWWLYREQLAGKLGFARGYHIEFWGGRRMPNFGTAAGLEWITGGSYGRKFKEDARRYYGSFIGFAGRGEMIPNADSYCDLDPAKRDKWGIPVLRFHWKWSDHETRQAAHMQRTFAELIQAMGGRTRTPPQLDGAKAIAPGGLIIHEVGGAIMGADPATSVTNQWSQTWDVPNLFLTDGAPFPSNADKNPTLTIMAQAWRAADHLVSELKKQNL